ncbi:hypothetical protein KCU87_g286, partial [Aureobasidium melanogenum]
MSRFYIINKKERRLGVPLPGADVIMHLRSELAFYDPSIVHCKPCRIFPNRHDPVFVKKWGGFCSFDSVTGPRRWNLKNECPKRKMPGKKEEEKAASEAAKNCRHRRRLIKNALLVMNESGNGEHATAANMFSADWLTTLGTLVFLPLQQFISGSGQLIVTGLFACETHAELIHHLCNANCCRSGYTYSAVNKSGNAGLPSFSYSRYISLGVRIRIQGTY